MVSTKRLIVLLIALLGTVGAAGSAVAGFVIEGDMNSLTAFLVLVLAVISAIIATAWWFINLIYRGKDSKSKFNRLLANQLLKDIRGVAPSDSDPTEAIRSLDKNVCVLIDLMMEMRANNQPDRWERPL